MAVTIIPKKSSVSSKVPLSGDLAVGEIAINLADGKIYTKRSDNSVINLSGSLEGHTHNISDVTGLQTALNNKVDSVNGLSGTVVLDTDDLSEGTSNLYFTDGRARSAISVSGDLSYSSSTGVISFSETYSSANELLTAIKTVDGSGSGLDADTLDGQDASEFATSTHSHSNATTSSDGFMSSTDKQKLDGIESGAEVNSVDTVNGMIGDVVLDSDDVDEGTSNLYFTDGRARSAISVSGDLSYSSSTGVISFSETYSSASDIKTAYESNANTNAFTDSYKDKLDGIESGATADQTKADIDALGVDSATLDGQDGTYYLDYDNFINTPDGNYSDLSGTPRSDWTYINSNTTMSANTSYGVDFSSNLTLTMPSNPSIDDVVYIYNTQGDATNSVISRNGDPIMELSEDLTIDYNITSVNFVYNGTSWRIL